MLRTVNYEVKTTDASKQIYLKIKKKCVLHFFPIRKRKKGL